MTNCTWIIPEELAIFHVNPCRTDREMGNSSKTAQNSKILIRAFSSAIGCNHFHKKTFVFSKLFFFKSQNTFISHPSILCKCNMPIPKGIKLYLSATSTEHNFQKIESAGWWLSTENRVENDLGYSSSGQTRFHPRSRRKTSDLGNCCSECSADLLVKLRRRCYADEGT